MLDAVLDYAMTGGDVPLAFLENPERPATSESHSNDVLPQRMEGNQLHRYSKVLEQTNQNAAQPMVSNNIIISTICIVIDKKNMSTEYFIRN